MRIFVLKNRFALNGTGVVSFLPVPPIRTGDAPQCPSCGDFIGMLPLVPPIRVELEGDVNSLADVAFGPAGDLLISEKLRCAFEIAKLGGLLNFHPVEIVRTRPRISAHTLLPRYTYCNITRSKTAIDDGASGLIRDESVTCEDCRIGGVLKEFQRIVLEKQPAPKEDIFFARGLPGVMLTTEKFKTMVETNQISNCVLIPAEKFSYHD